MTVQYFERARMELLGNEALRARYNGQLPPGA
jgi:hypothetical protein